MRVSINCNAGSKSTRLADVAPELARILKRSLIYTPPSYGVSEIGVQTVMVAMRDGVRLATDLYLPPRRSAPTVAVRTPYGRAADGLVAVLLSFARRGYAVLSQDCRGTGDSEPDTWDYYMFEPEDGLDFVEWVSKQSWYDGFLGSFGGSYLGQTQWQMAIHPRMSAIIPEVSGLGIAINTAHIYMFVDAYSRSVGKGDGKVSIHYSEMECLMAEETAAGGFFNEPLKRPIPEALLARFPDLPKTLSVRAQRELWEHYCSLTCASRTEFVKLAMGTTSVTINEVESLSTVFGHEISHDRHTLPHPVPSDLCHAFHAPALLRTGWYDWGLNDALATWDLLSRHAPKSIRSRCRLFIAPSAHNMPGYHEGVAEHPELHHNYTGSANFEMMLRWHAAVREDTLDSWPTVIYYLMGANEWRVAESWPLQDAKMVAHYLHEDGVLSPEAPRGSSKPESYVYDPANPTPTVGGSIVSYVYPPGSVDVSEVQARSDVLTFTLGPLGDDLDVVGPLRLVLYASSTAVDSDFVGRLSDVFPDGRAIQLQNGVLRARYRNLERGAELMEPGDVYRFEIDMWATANRFRAGHSLRLDISSADFPRFDRNSNLGGEPGEPLKAVQTIYHDEEHPSHILLPVLKSSR